MLVKLLLLMVTCGIGVCHGGGGGCSCIKGPQNSTVVCNENLSNFTKACASPTVALLYLTECPIGIVMQSSIRSIVVIGEEYCNCESFSAFRRITVCRPLPPPTTTPPAAQNDGGLSAILVLVFLFMFGVAFKIYRIRVSKSVPLALPTVGSAPILISYEQLPVETAV